MCILAEKVRAGTYDREVSASEKITSHQRRVLNFDSQSSELSCKRSDLEKSDFQTSRVLVHVRPSVVGCCAGEHSVRFRPCPACDSVTFAVQLSVSVAVWSFVLSYTFLLFWILGVLSCPDQIRIFHYLACSWMFRGLSSCPPRLLAYLLLELARFCDLLSYCCVFSLLSRPSFTRSWLCSSVSGICVHKLALPKLASCSRSAPSSSHQTQSLLAACLMTARRCTFMWLLFLVRVPWPSAVWRMRGTIGVSGTCPAGHERTTPSPGALDALAGPSYDSLHKIRLLSRTLAALTRALATPANCNPRRCQVCTAISCPMDDGSGNMLPAGWVHNGYGTHSSSFYGTLLCLSRWSPVFQSSVLPMSK